MTDRKRRRLIQGLAAGSALGLTGCQSLYSASSIALPDYPFKLGVASGEPGIGDLVLWTRLAPNPIAGGGMPQINVPVRWELAADESMRQVLRQGRVTAGPRFAHAVHVELNHLEPGREYFYRFYAAGEASPVGRTATLPENPQRLRFAMASCQHLERGYFGAYQHIINDSPDFLVFLGDYFYETGGGRNRLRSHARGEPMSLEDYRIRLAEYRLDPDLQEAHRLIPWVANWDDHEVDNDYAGLDNQDLASHALFAARRRAAYQAFYEHMPLRQKSRPAGNAMQLYRALEFGGLARLLVLDGRQYRSVQACREEARKTGRALGPDCLERLEPERSYLGGVQELWVESQLRKRQPDWTILAGPQVFSPFEQTKNDLPAFWNDDWNGYPAARKRLIAALQAHAVKNPVFVGGDVHSFWANQVPSDPDRRDSAPVASEFVTTAITSNGPPYDFFMQQMPKNPHVKYFESRYRGYSLCQMTRERWQTDCYSVDRSSAKPERVRLASFVVDSGNPSPQRA